MVRGQIKVEAGRHFIVNSALLEVILCWVIDNVVRMHGNVEVYKCRIWILNPRHETLHVFTPSLLATHGVNVFIHITHDSCMSH